MASELDFDRLVKLLKRDGDIGQAEAARELGITIGQLGMVKFCQAQVEAGVYGKAPGTAASVKKLRDGEGNRWELIAARTGKSVAAVKELYPGDASKRLTGNGSSNGKKATTATRGAAKPGRKPASTKKPTGRKAAAEGKVIRRTTRLSTATNPS
jgi:hypothetical protein